MTRKIKMAAVTVIVAGAIAAFGGVAPASASAVSAEPVFCC